MSTNDPIALTADRIRDTLAALNTEMACVDEVAELCLFDGTAMVLVFRARPSTKDRRRQLRTDRPGAGGRAAGRSALDLPPDWLNDGVKGFVSAHGRATEAPLPPLSHLRMMVPVPEYLLAMKCMAARIGRVSDEADDEVLCVGSPRGSSSG